MNMLIRTAANISNGTSITINNPVALHFIARHFPRVQVLRCFPLGFIHKVDNEILSPMINVRKLSFHGSHKGAEHLFERLELTKRKYSFSLKEWCAIIDAFPRLQSLYLSFLSKRCPPKIWIDVLIDNLQRSKTNKLVLL
jgi:hypothetical protein